MRITLIYGLLLGLILMLFSTADAATGKATCKVETNDIGTIIGHGKSPDLAFEDAATQCFERRTALYKAKYQRAVAQDDAELYIDICANVRCQ